MAHLGGARPAHGQRWPERRAARRLGLQVELVCERVSRERGPPDTILGRERRWVLVRGWENLFLVRERRFGVRREGARGRDRRRGVRGRSRDDALRDPCASRSSPGDGALDASPVRSPPEIDPPPRGALGAGRDGRVRRRWLWTPRRRGRLWDRRVVVGMFSPPRRGEGTPSTRVPS